MVDFVEGKGEAGNRAGLSKGALARGNDACAVRNARFCEENGPVCYFGGNREGLKAG